MPDRLVIASYNVGNPRDDSVSRSIRRLIDREGVDILGLQEMGDRAGVAARLAADPNITVCRRRKGGANRVALILDAVKADHWDTVQINRGGEKIERTVAGNGETRNGFKSAEAKFIVEAQITDDGPLVGDVHLIPSTANKTITGKWRHPLAREVYKTQVAGCVAWFAAGGDVLVGDFNGTPDYGLLDPLRAVADCYSAPSRKKPRRIDQIYVRKGSGITVDEVHAVDDVSSDHPGIVAALVLPAEPARPTAKSPEARAAGLIRTKLIPTVERAPVAERLEAAAAWIETGETP